MPVLTNACERQVRYSGERKGLASNRTSSHHLSHCNDNDNNAQNAQAGTPKTPDVRKGNHPICTYGTESADNHPGETHKITDARRSLSSILSDGIASVDPELGAGDVV